MKLKHNIIFLLRKRDTKEKRKEWGEKRRLTQEVGNQKREKREREEGGRTGQGESFLSGPEEDAAGHGIIPLGAFLPGLPASVRLRLTHGPGFLFQTSSVMPFSYLLFINHSNSFMNDRLREILDFCSAHSVLDKN